jgi:hypothetical protein
MAPCTRGRVEEEEGGCACSDATNGPTPLVAGKLPTNAGGLAAAPSMLASCWPSHARIMIVLATDEWKEKQWQQELVTPIPRQGPRKRSHMNKRTSPGDVTLRIRETTTPKGLPCATRADDPTQLSPTRTTGGVTVRNKSW